MVLVEQPAQNATLPLNGRVELAFNHLVQVGEAVREAQLVSEGAAIAVRLDNQRVVRVQGNRVLFFFDPLVMAEGDYLLSIPAGAFESQAGRASGEIEVPVWVTGKQCNTNYVVSGMMGEKCRCFSVGDRCQCTCGETSFSREY